MNEKNGNKRKNILLVDLLEYIVKYQYARYIFSSHYNDECLNENINKHTFRMNLVFKEMSIRFNPNQILLYNFMDFKSTNSQYVIEICQDKRDGDGNKNRFCKWKSVK